VAAVYISLLGQPLRMRSAILTSPFGQCVGLCGLHLLGARCMLGILSEAVLVANNHPFEYDCVEMGLNKGGNPTYVLRSMLLRGAVCVCVCVFLSSGYEGGYC
jgi:hypothetical protein